MKYEGPGSGVLQLWSVAQVLAQLRYYRPRHCVYLMPTDRTPRQIGRDKLFFKAAGIRDLHGFIPVTKNETLREDLSQLQTTEAFLRFWRVWGLDADAQFPNYAAVPLLRPPASAYRKVNEWFAVNRRHPRWPLVAFCPYANETARTLPFNSICSLLSRLEAELGLEAVLLGGRKDSTDAEHATRESGAGLNACGAFSLEESAAFLESCRVVVTTETGPMHLAGALGVPFVATFSRVTIRVNQWFPIAVNSSLLFRDVECAGCEFSNCDVPGHPCLSGIKVDHIMAAVAGKLHGAPVCSQMLDGTRLVEWTTDLTVHV
jgi:hypothetical protein